MGTYAEVSLGIERTPLAKKRFFLSYAVDDESARGPEPDAGNFLRKKLRNS